MIGLNTTKKKIALVGSAPSSVQLAPYEDPEWFIFGCSPGAYPYAIKHAGAWMENHRFEPQIPGMIGSGKPWFTPEYVEALVRFKGPVFMNDPLPPEIPHAIPLQAVELAEKYGPFFWTSSLSWMFAMALETPGVTEIGLWGVDMSAHEEYGLQRPGCQYFITLAMQRGIKVTIPPESDLLQPPFWYGVTENTPMAIKLRARRTELTTRHQGVKQQLVALNNEDNFLAGAIDDLDYMEKTWLTHQTWIEPTLGKTGNEVRADNITSINSFEDNQSMAKECRESSCVYEKPEDEPPPKTSAELRAIEDG
jgi:hypothetical protein